MRGLPIKHYRYAIEQTGAVVDKPSTFIFKRLKEAVESRIMAAENAEQMAVLSEEEVLNVQLIQEVRQQRNELDHGRDGRLLNPVRPGVRGGPLVQSPTTDQAAVQGPAQGYSLVLGYEDWQNSTRAPFVPQDLRPPQGSRYPQDSTTFRRPQWDARG